MSLVTPHLTDLNSIGQTFCAYSWKHAFDDLQTTATVIFTPQLGSSECVNGNLGISNGGGNRQTTQYTITSPTSFRTSMMASTMMLPPPIFQETEKLTQQLFGQRSVEFDLQVSKDTDDTATLALTDANGKSYLFQGSMLPDAKYGKAETVFYDIQPQRDSNGAYIARQVHYDENFVKSTVDEYASWPVQIINIPQFDDNVRVRLRLKKYIDPKTTQPIYYYDMTVQQELL